MFFINMPITICFLSYFFLNKTAHRSFKCVQQFKFFAIKRRRFGPRLWKPHVLFTSSALAHRRPYAIYIHMCYAVPFKWFAADF